MIGELPGPSHLRVQRSVTPKLGGADFLPER